MKGFIEVTDKEDNKKMLLPVDKIVNVEVDTDGQPWVDMFVNVKGDFFGVPTVESFDELKEKLELATR